MKSIVYASNDKEGKTMCGQEISPDQFYYLLVDWCHTWCYNKEKRLTNVTQEVFA